MPVDISLQIFRCQTARSYPRSQRQRDSVYGCFDEAPQNEQGWCDFFAVDCFGSALHRARPRAGLPLPVCHCCSAQSPSYLIMPQNLFGQGAGAAACPSVHNSQPLARTSRIARLFHLCLAAHWCSSPHCLPKGRVSPACDEQHCQFAADHTKFAIRCAVLGGDLQLCECVPAQAGLSLAQAPFYQEVRCPLR